MYSKQFKIAKKIISTVMLLAIGLHTISIDALGESLIYCFESDGSINIETKCDVTDNISVTVVDHDHFGYEYHDGSENHFDIEILDTCIKDIRTNRFDQGSALDFLAFKNNCIDSYLPISALGQIHSFTSTNTELQSVISLKTVVLRN